MPSSNRLRNKISANSSTDIDPLVFLERNLNPGPNEELPLPPEPDNDHQVDMVLHSNENEHQVQTELESQHMATGETDVSKESPAANDSLVADTGRSDIKIQSESREDLYTKADVVPEFVNESKIENDNPGLSIDPNEKNEVNEVEKNIQAAQDANNVISNNNADLKNTGNEINGKNRQSEQPSNGVISQRIPFDKREPFNVNIVPEKPNTEIIIGQPYNEKKNMQVGPGFEQVQSVGYPSNNQRLNIADIGNKIESKPVELNRATDGDSKPIHLYNVAADRVEKDEQNMQPHADFESKHSLAQMVNPNGKVDSSNLGQSRNYFDKAGYAQFGSTTTISGIGIVDGPEKESPTLGKQHDLTMKDLHKPNKAVAELYLGSGNDSGTNSLPKKEAIFVDGTSDKGMAMSRHLLNAKHNQLIENKITNDPYLTETDIDPNTVQELENTMQSINNLLPKAGDSLGMYDIKKEKDMSGNEQQVSSVNLAMYDLNNEKDLSSKEKNELVKEKMNYLAALSQSVNGVKPGLVKTGQQNPKMVDSLGMYDPGMKQPDTKLKDVSDSSKTTVPTTTKAAIPKEPKLSPIRNNYRPKNTQVYFFI